jgi:hypothetical protein
LDLKTQEIGIPMSKMENFSNLFEEVGELSGAERHFVSP